MGAGNSGLPPRIGDFPTLPDTAHAIETDGGSGNSVFLPVGNAPFRSRPRAPSTFLRPRAQRGDPVAELLPEMIGRVHHRRRESRGQPALRHSHTTSTLDRACESGEPLAALRVAPYWGNLPSCPLVASLAHWRCSRAGSHYARLPGRCAGCSMVRKDGWPLLAVPISTHRGIRSSCCATWFCFLVMPRRSR